MPSREQRRTLTEPGINSPDRIEPAARGPDLFDRMRAERISRRKYVLRARIDMAAPNINLRDPVIYRIPPPVPILEPREYLGIVPQYDLPRPEVAIEQHHSTHSVRWSSRIIDPYDWLIEHLPVPSPDPQQDRIFTTQSRISLYFQSAPDTPCRRRSRSMAGRSSPAGPLPVICTPRIHTRKSMFASFCSEIGVTKI